MLKIFVRVLIDAVIDNLTSGVFIRERSELALIHFAMDLNFENNFFFLNRGQLFYCGSFHASWLRWVKHQRMKSNEIQVCPVSLKPFPAVWGLNFFPTSPVRKYLPATHFPPPPPFSSPAGRLQ